MSHVLADLTVKLPLAARCRLAFLAGSLEAWREANRSEPPPDVLARILARYPDNPGELARPPRHEPRR
jgi:hypothetical protein